MLPLLDKGLKTYKYPVYVSDIATAVMNIISDPDTQGKTYEFVGYVTTCTCTYTTGDIVML